VDVHFPWSHGVLEATKWLTRCVFPIEMASHCGKKLHQRVEGLYLWFIAEMERFIAFLACLKMGDLPEAKMMIDHFGGYPWVPCLKRNPNMDIGSDVA